MRPIQSRLVNFNRYFFGKLLLQEGNNATVSVLGMAPLVVGEVGHLSRIADHEQARGALGNSLQYVKVVPCQILNLVNEDMREDASNPIDYCSTALVVATHCKF